MTPPFWNREKRSPTMDGAETEPVTDSEAGLPEQQAVVDGDGDDGLGQDAVPVIDGTRQVDVRRGGVGAGGNIEGSAFGANSQVLYVREQHVHQALVPESEVVWPVEIGPVPGLASAFQPRAAVRERVDAARSRGGAVVLTQVLCGGGGVGKSQLAAAYAIDALAEGTDLVVWAGAMDVQQVITQYAQAAVRVRAPKADGRDPETDARAFLAWLGTTSRRWLVVLDDVTDPAVMGSWWPVSRTGSGWVLATTRLQDARLTGGGRTRIGIDVYTVEEAVTYVQDRLTGDGVEYLLDDQVGALAEALGLLPLALGHAAAYMINEELTCAAYLDRFNHRQTRLGQALPSWADTEGYGREVAITLLLSLDAARAADPAGLAEPVLRLAALLDPAGHPHALWSTQAALAHLGGHRAEPSQQQDFGELPSITSEQAHSALRLLHRYALLACNTSAEPRAIRIHALTARAVRETTVEEQVPVLAVAAADMLREVWPEPDHADADLAAALRANTGILDHHSGDHLWQPEAHEVLFRSGTSLFDSGLASVSYWHDLATRSERILGSEHPTALVACGNLATSYRQVGRFEEAIRIAEQVVIDCERILGPEHPHTLSFRNSLAASYKQAGRTQEAIRLQEQVAIDRERILGPEHPATLTACGNLAASYKQAGRTQEAIRLQEQVAIDRERILGPEHPATLTACGNLAASYKQAGRTQEAIRLQEQVAIDRERILGPEHPATLSARGNLAHSYQQAGRTQEAIHLQEQVLSDHEHVLGPEHPATLTACGNLGTSYRQAGRIEEATRIMEQAVIDRERILGPEHPHTLTARRSVALCYRYTGRRVEAIRIQEQAVVDHERVLGPEHPDTLSACGDLATSYRQAGRLEEAIHLQEQVLASFERILGPEHENALTARRDLATSYRRAGRAEEAIHLQEQVLASFEQILGPEHISAKTMQALLGVWRAQQNG
ncbi:tetratricopeptide repeat protein [Streptomyces inusitatus]|uniref:Tetratricopeptide repeat protein n=1 Tax=Streptomyces inusitatus TaxID=68221 RepID=A0A918QQT9_9ACTN|nr:tetratricopeptide repeat protein [Streptomyces inusitatus]GGZ60631.1 tetratricopeptide repeat protein [Streptomyces inusitatus]